MLYKVFDFKCKKCDHLVVNYMIDEKEEKPPICPECGGKTEKQVGTDFVRHVSWGQWHV